MFFFTEQKVLRTTGRMPVSSDVGTTYHILRKVHLGAGQLLEISGAIDYTRPAYDKGISDVYQGVVSASLSVVIVGCI